MREKTQNKYLVGCSIDYPMVSCFDVFSSLLQLGDSENG